MAVIALETEAAAWEFFKSLESPDAPLPELDEIFVGNWAALTVSIKKPVVNGAINATWMKAFVAAQESINRSYAVAKYGSADLRKLSEAEVEAIEVQFLISEGSTDAKGDLWQVVTVALSQAVDKLEPRVRIRIAVGAALIWGGFVAFDTFLDYQKDIRLAEIAAQTATAQAKATVAQAAGTVEQAIAIGAQAQAAIEQAKVSAAQVKLMTELTDFLKQTPVGQQVIASGDGIHEQMLKAAANTELSVIQGRSITAGEAQELRSSTRKRASLKIVQQELRVTNVDTHASRATEITFSDPTGNEFRASFQDALLEQLGAMDALHAALRSRGNVWVEYQTREIDGEIRSYEIRSVLPNPPENVSVADRQQEERH